MASRFSRCWRTFGRQLQVRTAPLSSHTSRLETSSLQGNRAPISCLFSRRHFTELTKGFRYLEDYRSGSGTLRRFASTHEILANRDIPFQRVRVVDDSGLVGDFNLQEALILAKERRTDLVVLSGQVDPPLCRLVNLHVYVDELEKQAASKEQKQREQKLREFSFDPAMRVKGMRFATVIAEHDFERKVNQVRDFLKKGHRVEARILQSRGTAEDVLDLALRIVAEVRDIAKPEYFEESIRELQMAIHSPKSLKRRGKAPPDELRVRLWPCSPDQAAAFQLPAHIIGPRRRRGPAIVGVDDKELDEDAWKFNRKPHPASRSLPKSEMRRQALDDS